MDYSLFPANQVVLARVHQSITLYSTVLLIGKSTEVAPSQSMEAIESMDGLVATTSYARPDLLIRATLLHTVVVFELRTNDLAGDLIVRASHEFSPNILRVAYDARKMPTRAERELRELLTALSEQPDTIQPEEKQPGKFSRMVHGCFILLRSSPTDTTAQRKEK